MNCSIPEHLVELPVVYIVDDDESLRSALARLLKTAGYKVRGFASVVDFLMAKREGVTGCLVLDVNLPGGPSGLELQKSLREHGESIPIIFITGNGDIPTTVRAIKNGAFDFLAKPVDPDAFLAVVRAAIDSQEVSRDTINRRFDLESKFQSLSSEEREVFLRVVKGQMNKQIAIDLDCSERTIKSRRAQVLVKMGVESLAELVGLAKDLGI